ncbi:hypothetical protein C7212DRAFT_343562 [Tuber magnatum]|uniref:Uncharacterized protein n=1 Tax=Tuber magnatum TaxID=42249 RepID=A0A317STC6_9PEZI|nr:hypothetical protein C7212DRAFT_343562 [Tuber magnatum]
MPLPRYFLGGLRFRPGMRVGMVTKRSFSTTSVSYTKYMWLPSSLFHDLVVEISGEEQGHAGDGNGAHDANTENFKTVDKEHSVSMDGFHKLDKTVSGLSIKIDMLRRDVDNIGKKLDPLFYAILAGVGLGGGFDLFRDERNWSRSYHVKESQ